MLSGLVSSSYRPSDPRLYARIGARDPSNNFTLAACSFWTKEKNSWSEYNASKVFKTKPL